MKRRGLTMMVGVCWLGAGALSAADFQTIQKTLAIPSGIATVVDANTTGVPEYILIQDIHRHPEVQANIAALLLHATRHWGITNAYLEGAYSGQTIPTAASGKSLKGKLDDGSLSGAEMAAAMVKEGVIKLVGIEDPDVYRENVEAYQAALQQQAQALREIKTLRMVQRTLDFSEQSLSEKQLERMELLARLKLKPAEYALYLEDRRIQPLSAELAGTLAAAESFYRLAEERSRIFTQEALLQEGPEPKAFVIGGFHAAEMASELKQAGKSYVVISPRITRSGYEHLYAERMSETISALKLR